MITTKLRLVAAMAVLPAAAFAQGTAPAKKIGYDDSPMQPGGRFRIHDGGRPAPALVSPAKAPAGAPSDAVVLLGKGNDLSRWVMRDGSPMSWKISKGVLESGKGYIQTKDEFRDFQLHIEWATPKVVKGEGQGRGNSGVFLLGKFEVQVLDSFGNVTYPDGQAAGLYGQYPPLVNASLGPGKWQTYDILFTAPRFGAGKLDKPAVVTVLHNGVLVHNATPFFGPTAHKKIGDYSPETEKGPIALQDHGNPVHFRNIWLRPLKAYDEP